MRLAAIVVGAFGLFAGSTANADNLFHDQSWANVASDQKASHVGDIITVIVFQNAEARNGA